MNEKVNSAIRDIFICIVIFICGYLLGNYIHIGQSRELRNRITELEQTVSTQQSEFESTVTELAARCESLNGNLTDAKQLVDSMGTQLVNDSGNLEAAAAYIRVLRKEIKDLQDMFPDSNSCISGTNSLDNTRGE